MTTAESKALARRYFEQVLNTGDLAAIDTVFAADFCKIFREYPARDAVENRDGFKQLVIDLRTGIPDMHFTIEDLIAEGDKVAVRWTMRGSHRGTLWGWAPTGSRLIVTGMSILRIADGKIVEEHVAEEAWMAHSHHPALQSIHVENRPTADGVRFV